MPKRIEDPSSVPSYRIEAMQAVLASLGAAMTTMIDDPSVMSVRFDVENCQCCSASRRLSAADHYARMTFEAIQHAQHFAELARDTSKLEENGEIHERIEELMDAIGTEDRKMRLARRLARKRAA